MKRKATAFIAGSFVLLALTYFGVKNGMLDFYVDALSGNFGGEKKSELAFVEPDVRDTLEEHVKNTKNTADLIKEAEKAGSTLEDEQGAEEGSAEEAGLTEDEQADETQGSGAAKPPVGDKPSGSGKQSGSGSQSGAGQSDAEKRAAEEAAKKAAEEEAARKAAEEAAKKAAEEEAARKAAEEEAARKAAEEEAAKKAAEEEAAKKAAEAKRQLEADATKQMSEAKTKNMANEIHRLTNAERNKVGKSPLNLNQNLCRIAQIKALDMARNGYFDHNSPTYGSPFNMMTNFGFNYYAAAENIAYGYGSASDAVQGWMGSSGHKANILDEKNYGFTEIGIGYALSANGTPYYVQMFAKVG